MHNLILGLMAGAALLAGGAAQAATDRSPGAQLARATAGRVAGAPVDCITLRDIRSSRIIDRTAIVYEMNGGRVYVNHPESGASSLDSNDILVTDTHSPQLCSIDIVRLIDNGSHFPSGSIGLGKFVPWTKADRAATN